MYGKLFAQMYDGSLYGNWKALATFQQMIILCGPDGVIDMTPQAIAARTSFPLEIIQEGIDVLEAPDRYSRTPDHDGRRIERLDAHRPWGWQILNHGKYRRMVSVDEKREADRNRIAAKRQAQRDMSQGVAMRRKASQGVADVVHTEAEAEAEELNTCAKAAPCALFDEFWLAYPRKKSKGDALRAYRAVAAEHAAIMAGLARAKRSADWLKDGGQFIPYPATWLRARGWEDELSSAAPEKNIFAA